MSKYEEICEKLGVDIDNYEFHTPYSEDDNDYDNISFNKLTVEELDWLIDHRFKVLKLK